MHRMRISTWFKLLFLILGVLLVIYLAQLLLHRGKSGCPAEFENTTENAQVFLMGTIGGKYSDPNRDCWREYVVQPELQQLGVTFYNPVVEEWTEENAREEAEAIANSETIVLVITANHPSIGSLAESGWAVLSALERDQTVILFIAKDQSNEDSLRARKIVLSQAKTLAPHIDQLVMVNNLGQVVDALHTLYGR